MLEKDIEAKFGEKLSSWAYEQNINVMYVKFSGVKGWPDRIVTWGGPGGPPHLIWIEWKRPNEEPRPLQLHIHKLLQGMGHDVRIYDDYRVALAEVQEEIRATLRADQGNETDCVLRGVAPIPPARKRKDRGSAKGVHNSEEAGHGGLLVGTGPAEGSND